MRETGVINSNKFENGVIAIVVIILFVLSVLSASKKIF